MISAPDRRMAVELIDEARSNGARLEPACRTLHITSRTYQRWTRGGRLRVDRRPEAVRPPPRNKLTADERERVLRLCHTRAYASLPPGQIVPRLADQGLYIASESSFYRILHAAGQQHHRGRSRRPNRRPAPKGYRATGPNQVWSWDITYLPTTIRGLFFFLYMILDVFSRKIVGWEVHERESARFAANLVHKAVLSEGCLLDPPVLHADNGAPQRGFTLMAKLDALGIASSYSRPRVSNDNPFSEALFRTVKYRPRYPHRGFADLESARRWVMRFVHWYNHDHQHSAIRFVTPSQRHSGQDAQILRARRRVYEEAKAQHPERWSGRTRNWELIAEVWLNPPADTETQKTSARAA
jgi:transposase InsO family protein